MGRTLRPPCAIEGYDNAGSNPVSLRLRRSDLEKPVVQELLRASFEALAPGTPPWSERHPQVALDDSLALTDSVEIEHSHGDTRPLTTLH